MLPGKSYSIEKDLYSDPPEPGKREKREGRNQKESCCTTGISCEIDGGSGRAVKGREPEFCNVLFELKKKIEED